MYGGDLTSAQHFLIDDSRAGLEDGSGENFSMLKVTGVRLVMLATFVQFSMLMLLTFGDFGHDDWGLPVFTYTVALVFGVVVAALDKRWWFIVLQFAIPIALVSCLLLGIVETNW